MNVTLKGTVPVYYSFEIPDKFIPLTKREPQNNELLDDLYSWLDENVDRLNLPHDMELEWIMTKEGKFVTIR